MKVEVTTRSSEDKSNNSCCGYFILFLIIAVVSVLLFGEGVAGFIIIAAMVILLVAFFTDIFSSDKKTQTYVFKDGERREIEVDPNLEELNISIALQEELQELALAKQKSQLSQEVIDDVLHELKNPLSVIKGNLSLMKRKKRQSRKLKLMEGAVERIEKLMGNNLLLSGLNSKEIQKKFQVIDLSRVVGKAVHSFEQKARQKGIKLKTKLKRLEILGNFFYFETLVGNLIENAIKYSPKGSDIVITLGQRRKEARLEVKDQGIGIPGRELKNVFKKFFRGSNLKRGSEGTGLGLVIVEKITKLHQGKVGVKSKLNQGSTFWVELPQA